MANITDNYLEAAKLSSKIISVVYTAGDGVMGVKGDTYTLTFSNGFSSIVEFGVGYPPSLVSRRKAIATMSSYDYINNNDISLLKSNNIQADLEKYIREQLTKFPATADLKK